MIGYSNLRLPLDLGLTQHPSHPPRSSAPSLAQLAAGHAAFDCDEELKGHVERYATNRAILLEGLRDMGFDKVAPADGAFYIYVDTAEQLEDSVQFCRVRATVSDPCHLRMCELARGHGCVSAEAAYGWVKCSHGSLASRIYSRPPTWHSRRGPTLKVGEVMLIAKLLASA
jgi:hypothetical protein